MGPVSAVTAIIASQLALKVDARYILMALLVILVLVAIRTLFASFLKKEYIASPELSSKQKAFSCAGGALAGLTSGFAGVGSGVGSAVTWRPHNPQYSPGTLSDWSQIVSVIQS